MGDRRMAELRTVDGKSLYVYTHWHGTEFPDICRAAMEAAKGHRGDSYWLRIMVDQITKEGRDKTTGWGLLLTPGGEDSYNGDRPSVICDEASGDVTVVGRD